MISFLACFASLAGTWMILRSRVCMRAVVMPAVRAAAWARLYAMTAKPSQAWFAVNFPDGRCASGPCLSSEITCSTIAWARWRWSASIVPSTAGSLLVTNA